MSIELSIDKLDELGRSLDQVASCLERGDQDESLGHLAEGLDRAERSIAALVVEAESCQRLADQRLVDLKVEWLDRFARLFELVERMRRQLDREADLRLTRHRAADSYLKNQAV